jgi:hypothetical protein
VAPLVEVMRGQRWMRRFDFDTEAVVRLAWRGVRPLNLAAPVKYLRPEEGGVSHFRYGRDNTLLTWMHLRLMGGFLLRLPSLLARPPGRPPPVRSLGEADNTFPKRQVRAARPRATLGHVRGHPR